MSFIPLEVITHFMFIRATNNISIVKIYPTSWERGVYYSFCVCMCVPVILFPQYLCCCTI